MKALVYFPAKESEQKHLMSIVSMLHTEKIISYINNLNISSEYKTILLEKLKTDKEKNHAE